jgi:hypothetical protein
MSSTSTRYELVIRALQLAGRGVELRSSVEQWLNDILKSWALEYKWPALRKVGSSQTLSAGTSTVSLPSDMGSGMESLTFGDEKVPLDEYSMDEFVIRGGFPSSGASSGRPSFYTVDREAGLFRFNVAADQNYSFTPIYFKVPDAIAQTSSGDNQTVWVDDDNLVVQGLIQMIYQYTGDQREFAQEQKVNAMKATLKRGLVPMSGGPARMQLSRVRFKR